MATQFSILFSCKVREAVQPFARFELGCNRSTANALFEELTGSTAVAEGPALCIELMESTQGLPVNLRMKTCSLSELESNCSLITKTIFKTLYLRDGTGEQ